MDAKPEWVPERVWADFELYRESMSNADASLSGVKSDEVQRRLGRLESALRDRQCDCVWKAVTSRDDAGTHIDRMETFLVQLSQIDTVTMMRVLDARLIKSGAVRLFAMLEAASSGLAICDTIPASLRREGGKRIGKLAAELWLELAALREASGGHLPDPFGEHLSKAAHKLHAVILEQNGTSYDDAESKPFANDPTHMGYAILETMLLPEISLRAILDGSEKWAQSKPPVGRPSDANANRLHFIREITSYFRATYDTPLREPVAALTRSIYQCEMDAATVAKLAP